MSACAYFDSSNNSLNFVENTGGWTNGQVVGSRTYYTGFETSVYDYTNRPPWDRQFDNIRIVNFNVSVTPISTAWWFHDFSNLIRINNLNLLNTSRVTNMDSMFYYCSSLTSLDLSSFDTSKVTDMEYMFFHCTSLTSLDLSNFDTSNVTNMHSMFSLCESLASLDLSNFNTSNVTNMNGMFSSCTTLTSFDLSNFDTSSVTGMTSMFSYCTSLTSLDLSTFNTGSATNMDAMFSDCRSLTSLDLSSFDTGNVTTMSDMFLDCESLTSLDLSNFDTSKVTDMSSMFYQCSLLVSLDLSSFNTSNVTNMSSMFCNCGILTSLDLSSFDTSNVIYMNNMFHGTSLTSLDLSSFDTSNVTLMSYMFAYCSHLKYIRVSDLWSTNRVTNSSYMFSGCTSLSNYNASYTDKTYAYAGYPGYLVNSACAYYDSSDNSFNFVGDDNNYADEQVVGTKTYYKNIETIRYSITTWPKWKDTNHLIKEVKILMPIKPISTARWFESCSSLTSLDLSLLDTSQVVDMFDMFTGCSSLTSLDLSNFNTSNVTNMSFMFDTCESLTSLDLSSFDTSKVNDMHNMFYYCLSLTSLDLSNFNTSNVTNMSLMFDICFRLTSLDLSSFNTNKVTNMRYMFEYCQSLTSLDLSNFDTSNVTDMENMFRYCTSLTSLELSNFNTSKVTDMSHMFSYCTSLILLDLSLFNTSNVTDMSGMFQNCNSLTSLYLSNLYLSNFDTSKVTDMSYMFQNCSALTSLDLSSFNTNLTERMDFMFQNCSRLTSLNLSSFNTSNVTDMTSMFGSCNSLTLLDLSSFNTDSIGSFGVVSMFQGNNLLTVVIWDPDTTKDYSQIFSDVTDLYIIRPTTQRTNTVLATKWRNIIGTNSEVHFEYDHTLKPTITHTIERGKKVDNQWTPDDTEGTVIQLIYTPTVYQNDFSPLLETNTLDNTARIIYSDNTDISNLVTYTTEGTTIIAEFDIGDAAQHNITLQLQDKHDSPTLFNITLPGIFAMIEFRAGGKGMSIGKVSTRDGLDIAIPTTIGEGLIPPQEQQYVKTEDTAIDSDKTYYILNSNNQYEEVDSPNIEDISNYYELKYIEGTIDLTNYQLTIGKYNIHKPTALFIVGAGDSNINRRNVLELDEMGLRIYATDSTIQLANIGYGEGKTEREEKAIAPYYSFGRRKTENTFGNYSVVEGFLNDATGMSSHAEGVETTAGGYASHTEGWRTLAGNSYSHAQGEVTSAIAQAQTTMGTYNISEHDLVHTTHPSGTGDYGHYALIIGNGTFYKYSNALTIDWQGNVMGQGMAGMVQMYAGAGTQTVTDGVATTTNLPLGWLLCDGSSLLIEEYPELAAALWDETTYTYIYGAADSTHFNLPDFRGRAPVGVGTGTATNATAHTLGQQGGNEKAVVISHNHVIPSGAMTSSGMSANASHSHTTGGTAADDNDRFITMSSSGDSVKRRTIKNGTGTSYEHMVYSDGSTFQRKTSTQSVSTAHTHTVPNAAYTVPAPSGSTAASTNQTNMMPYLGINYIIATGKTSY